MLNEMVSALDEATLLALKEEIEGLAQLAYRALIRRMVLRRLEEQVSRLSNGRPPRQTAELAYQHVFKHAAAERLASFAVSAISTSLVGDQGGQNGKEKEALQEIVRVLGRTSVVPKGFPSFVRRGEGR